METWVIEQFDDAADLAQAAPAVRAAVDGSEAIGISARFKWSAAADLSLLDQARSEFAGYSLAIRLMAGRYTPAASMGRFFIYNGAETGGQGSGSKVPMPFSSSGGPNAVFESAWIAQAAAVMDWSRHNGVRLVHLPWPGLLWAELALVAQQQAAVGYSMDAAAAAHFRLMDAALSLAADDLTIEFPISGHCPAELRTRITAHVRADAELQARCIIQSNNLDASGQGVPTKPDGIRRAFQMVGTSSYNWPLVFDACDRAWVEYLEVYTPSFSAAGADSLRAEIAERSQASALRAQQAQAAAQVAQEAAQLQAAQLQLAGVSAQLAALGA